MKEKRYEVFCEDFSYIVYASGLAGALQKFTDLWPDQVPFAVVETQYLEGRYLRIAECRDEGLAGLF